MQIVLKGEAAEKAKAKAAEKAKAKADRDEATAAAYEKALAEVGYDQDRLVVHMMPDTYGGAVVFKVPGVERWEHHTRRMTTAISSDGKKADIVSVMNAICADKDILVHPTLADLQAWQADFPGLLTTLHGTLDRRCGGESAGKG